VRIECPYRDFVRAWLREPSWESLRDGYVLPHRELLEAYNRSWGWGGDVEEDYRRRWGARPAEAGALVARLGQSGLPARLRSAAATARAVVRPAVRVRVVALVGVGASNACAFFAGGVPTAAIAVEAWGEDFFGVPLPWEDLPLWLAHELAHAVRYAEGDCGLARLFRAQEFDYDRALRELPLLEFLVDEGLAVEAAARAMPTAPAARALGFTEAELAWCEAHEGALWEAVRPHLGDPPGMAGYERYFSAGARQGMPARTGYYLGWRLVRGYLARRPEMDLAAALRLPAEAIAEEAMPCR